MLYCYILKYEGSDIKKVHFNRSWISLVNIIKVLLIFLINADLKTFIFMYMAIKLPGNHLGTIYLTFLLFTDLQKWKILPLKENISNPGIYQTSRSQNQSNLHKSIA